MPRLLKLLCAWLWLAVALASSPAQATGQFDHNADVGHVRHSGELTYHSGDQTYQLSGSGDNIWGKRDAFHFAWNEMEGDFIVRARVEFTGKGTHPHRKFAWQARESLEADAAHVSATVHADGLSALQFRERSGGATDEYRLKVKAPDVIQLERRGDTFIMSAARFGEPFQVTQASHLKLGATLKVGLALTAHDDSERAQVKLTNVRIIRPTDPDFTPYQDYIGSNLEIMDLADHNRRIVYRDPGSIQAPNWTHDGRFLIFNKDGHLYRYQIATGAVSEINTGFATANNNDHVLAWDGKRIGISHHAESEGGNSTIYTLPLSGTDDPRRITRPGVGHSYLHGFSPDDQTLIFTGHRQGQYDIYAVDADTGTETQLTDTPTLDDGSEYSPDGNRIYFNSNRTGTMQLWRMNPDGSGQQQLTFDRYNDWFPHVSPDGQSLIFLSYRRDVDSGAHPFYRHVYLRQIPIDGGQPRIIAYVYGGQGTLNVPSYSPDGGRISFITNTQLPE